MTSNLGSREIAEYAIRLQQDSDQSVELSSVKFPRKFRYEVVEPKLKKHFRRDEFLGHINEIVYFVPFSRPQLLQLVSKDLTVWQQRALSRHGLHLEWDNSLIDAVADGYNVYYGARSIRHEVERRVINLLAAAYERQLIQKGNCVKVTADAADSKSEDRTIRGFVRAETDEHSYKEMDFLDITESIRKECPANA